MSGGVVDYANAGFEEWHHAIADRKDDSMKTIRGDEVAPTVPPAAARPNFAPFDATDLDVELLSRTDRIVHACLTTHLQTGISMERTLRAMVLLLARHNKELTDRVIELACLQPPPPIVVDARVFDMAHGLRDAAATGEERDASNPKGDCL